MITTTPSCATVFVPGSGGEHHLAARDPQNGLQSLTLCLKKWTRRVSGGFSAKYDCAECAQAQEDLAELPSGAY